MNRAQFEHVLKAAADVVQDDLVVVGLEPDAGLYPEPFRTPFRLTGTNNAATVTFYLRTAVPIPAPGSWAGLLVTAIGSYTIFPRRRDAPAAPAS